MGAECGGDLGMAGGVEPEVGADEDPVAVHHERLDRLCDEFGDVAGGLGQAGRDLAGELLAALGVEGEEQLVEAVEVGVERAAGVARRLAYLLDAGPSEPAGRENAEGGVQKPAAGFGPAPGYPRRRAVGPEPRPAGPLAG